MTEESKAPFVPQWTGRLQVLESKDNQWYIGTMILDQKSMTQTPGDRWTEYMDYETAIETLDDWQNLSDEELAEVLPEQPFPPEEEEEEEEEDLVLTDEVQPGVTVVDHGEPPVLGDGQAHESGAPPKHPALEDKMEDPAPPPEPVGTEPAGGWPVTPPPETQE